MAVKPNEEIMSNLDEQEDPNVVVDLAEPEVEVIDDTPPEDRGRGAPIDPKDIEPGEDELKSYSKDVKARIDKLQRGYHDERRAREASDRKAEEALRYAQSVAASNKTLVERTNATSTQLHETTKGKAEGDLLNAKAAYKAAYEGGDSETIADAQEALSRATMRHEMAITSKEPLHVEKEGVKTTEDVYTSPEPDETAKAWATKNSWFRTDRRMTSLAYGVHEDLISRNIHPIKDADLYYGEIDKEMRKRFPDYEWGDKSGTPPRKPPTVVSSVTRTPKGQKVSLTQTQVAIAKRLNVPLAEYAKQVAALSGEK